MLEFMRDVRGMRKRLMEQGMSKEELEEAVKKKREEFSGLINEKAALYLLLKERGLDYALFVPSSMTKIGKLREGMKVNVRGRIERLYSLRTFEKNGKKGSVLNGILSDDSGSVRIVLWNRDAEMVERGTVGKGDLVEIINGIVKGGRNGLELHLPFSGSIRKVGESEKVKVRDIREDMKSVNMILRVLEVGAKSRFQRGEGEGKVAWCTVGDETGTTRLVLWDEKADILDRINVNDILRIEDGYVRKGMNDMEVHIGRFGRVIINPPDTDAADRRKIMRIPLVKLMDAEEGKEVEVHIRLGEVEELDDSWICPSCGRVEKNVCDRCGGEARRELYIKVGVRDESGETKATFRGKNVLRLLGIGRIPQDITLETMLKLKGAELRKTKYYVLGRMIEGDLNVERVLGKGQ